MFGRHCPGWTHEEDFGDEVVLVTIAMLTVFGFFEVDDVGSTGAMCSCHLETEFAPLDSEVAAVVLTDCP